MKVAVVTHNIVRGDGQGRCALEIAYRALRDGHTVDLYSSRIDRDVIDAGAQHFHISHSKLASKAVLIEVMEFSRAADRALKPRLGEYDIIQGHGDTLSLPHHVNNSQFCHDAYAKVKKSIPGTSSPSLYNLYQSIYTARNKNTESRAYSRAKAVVPASSLVRDELAAIGFGSKIDAVIPNGADPEIFFPGTEDRAALGLPVGVPLALFAGDIKTYRKNLDSVLKALVSVPGLQLAVVGRLEGSPFPALAASLGVSERVHFLDFRRDISSIMRACDFFVFPSRYEACALVLIEAMCTGLPIVTSKATGGAEFLKDAAIVLDEPNDVPGLARAMNELTENESRRSALRDIALTLRPEFSWERITDAWMEVWDRNKGTVG